MKYLLVAVIALGVLGILGFFVPGNTAGRGGRTTELRARSHYKRTNACRRRLLR
jgi:hypothetical protein